MVTVTIKMEADLFNRSAERLYWNLSFCVRFIEGFLRRGLTVDGWPMDGWPYLPCVMYARDLLITIRDMVGGLPRIGRTGTVGSVNGMIGWRGFGQARRGGGGGGGRGGGSGGRSGGGVGGGGGVASIEWV